MRDKDQQLLAEAYQQIITEAPGFQHSGQGPYRKAVDPETGEETGAQTSNYLKAQPHMGKKQHDEDELSDPQMQAGLAILQQYAQGDITSAKDVVNKFKKLYEQGVEQGPQQDDMYYTNLK